MERPARLVKTAGLALIGLAALVIALDLLLPTPLNLALPALFLALGGVFVLLVFLLAAGWSWSALLYVPGLLLLALGLVFLLNVLTNDWRSWAYAWLLVVAGAGAGLALSARALGWRRLLFTIGLGTALGGLALFAVFGAIAGGAFIQVITPVLLLLGGLALFRLKPGVFQPASPEQPALAKTVAGASVLSATSAPGLVELISTRELEVLRLIDAGLTNQQIAARLSVAQSTVKTHINNIYGKLEVQTRVQAVNRARQLGLLE